MVNIPSRDWRKKSHRLQDSRDEFKARNRKKAKKIKILEGRTLDLERSRSQWKKRYEEKTQENKKLADELVTKDELIEAERKLREQEKIVHAEELDRLKKNGRCCNTSPGRKRTKSPSPTLFGSFCPNVTSTGSCRRIKPSWGTGSIHPLLFLKVKKK